MGGNLKLIMIVFIIIGSIAVGNFFFTSLVGRSMASLPPGPKFVVHLCGIGLVALFIKKFIKK